MTSYLHLIECMCLSTLYYYRDRASYLSEVADFNLPHLHLASRLEVTRSNFVEIFGISKLETLGCRAAVCA